MLHAAIRILDEHCVAVILRMFNLADFLSKQSRQPCGGPVNSVDLTDLWHGRVRMCKAHKTVTLRDLSRDLK